MSTPIKTLCVGIAVIFVTVGCKKEITREVETTDKFQRAPVARPFKMTSDTWYRISPVIPAPVPGFPGQLSFANVPGGGTGNATHMGNITTWFNQLAYSPDGQNPPQGSAPASLLPVLSYPVLFPGAPLPLIQPGDFAALAAANSWLQLPASVSGNLVGSLVYNDHGDAIFCSSTTASVTVFISPTRINFSGKGIFVGGRGKFAAATGSYDFTGFFNPENANDAGYNVEGVIIY